MPIIMVYGLRGDPEHTRSFRDQLKRIVAGVQALGLKRNQVSVYLLAEFAPPNETDIIVEVKGLLVKPERTIEVQNTVARVLVRAIQRFFQEESRRRRLPQKSPLIEVFVYPFDPAHQGFASSHEAKAPKPN